MSAEQIFQHSETVTQMLMAPEAIRHSVAIAAWVVGAVALALPSLFVSAKVTMRMYVSAEQAFRAWVATVVAVGLGAGALIVALNAAACWSGVFATSMTLFGIATVFLVVAVESTRRVYHVPVGQAAINFAVALVMTGAGLGTAAHFLPSSEVDERIAVRRYFTVLPASASKEHPRNRELALLDLKIARFSGKTGRAEAMETRQKVLHDVFKRLNALRPAIGAEDKGALDRYLDLNTRYTAMVMQFKTDAPAVVEPAPAPQAAVPAVAAGPSPEVAFAKAKPAKKRK